MNAFVETANPMVNVVTRSQGKSDARDIWIAPVHFSRVDRH